LLEEEFPDTHVDVKLDGDRVRTRLKSSMSENDNAAPQDEEESEFYVTSGLPAVNSSVQKIKNKQKKANKNEKTQAKNQKSDGIKKKLPVVSEPSEGEDSSKPKKRGQHGRQKKLKEKYKFQDDEERQMKIQLLRVTRLVKLVNATVLWHICEVFSQFDYDI